MNNDVLRATALSDSFNILAVLTEYPSQDVAEGVASGALDADMAALCEELGMPSDGIESACASLQGVSSEELMEHMRRCYTALFNHPEHPLVPLYEEQYLFSRQQGSTQGKSEKLRKGAPMGDPGSPCLFVNPASLDALREYRSAGMVPGNERAMPADAMPMEMEFCGRLYLRLSHALFEEDKAQVEAAQVAIDEFSRYHLQKWMAGFYGDCASEATCDVYRAMGQFGMAVAEYLGLENKA